LTYNTMPVTIIYNTMPVTIIYNTMPVTIIYNTMPVTIIYVTMNKKNINHDILKHKKKSSNISCKLHACIWTIWTNHHLRMYTLNYSQIEEAGKLRNHLKCITSPGNYQHIFFDMQIWFDYCRHFLMFFRNTCL
jgi:hypothetical protein